ncbi:copper resistance CopC family protein [Neobacillus sp. SuZ13]|uniref:copper resistance CopC family protein n=1 Tax=Neobacillus sp. SuZ13 TaxID=3047875 RepID=UPI0024C00221|nr:copper resistance CopC family protein [Neobacillus sp. SuZ13]WHY66503.1 copper resistance protein CopC [Neobacillus sp. SuZ13]
MKKLLLILVGMLVMLPSIASAHTELTTSNPTSGQVVKEDLKEIVLTYEGKIESLSTMTLVKDGKEIPLVSVTPNDNQLIGTVSTALENGTYSVQWSIAGEDGHPISGEIPFTVQKVVKEEPKAETKQPVTPNKEEPKKENTNQQKTKNESTDSPLIMKNIILGVVVLILIIGVFLLFRRKR